MEADRAVAPRAADASPPTDASLLDLPSAESTFRSVGGVDLHVVAAGDPDDPLVVLLHGFPELWYAWRHQVPALVDAGYRVLAPDQRGYNLSDAPEGLDAYRLSRLSADVAALIDDAGRSSAHVVGHDWGATVAWDLALRHPDTVDRLCVANVPHPRALRDALRSNARQLLRSWYAFWFQLPRVPEWMLAREDFQRLASVLRSTSRPGTFGDDTLAVYRSAWATEGALTAMVNWYRAIVRRPDWQPRESVSQPTRILWGRQDHALLPELAEASLAYCEDGELRWFDDATHWVHLEEPERFSEAVLEHLAE